MSVTTPACRGSAGRRTAKSKSSGDAQRRQRDDERVRQPAADVDDPVDEADGRAGAEHRGHGQRATARRAEDHRADDCRQRQRRADRQVDAAGHDDEQLTHGEDRDHRRLRQDVAEILRRGEHRGEAGHDQHQNEQDQDRTELEQHEQRADQSELCDADLAVPDGGPDGCSRPRIGSLPLFRARSLDVALAGFVCRLHVVHRSASSLWWPSHYPGRHRMSTPFLRLSCRYRRSRRTHR